MKSNIIQRSTLIDLIGKAKKRIRVLGAVAFDLPYDKFKEDWLKKINAGKLTVEIICESDASLSYDALIASDRKVSGENRGYEMGDFVNASRDVVLKLRNFFVQKGCKNIEPAMGDEVQCFSVRTCYLPIKVPIINIDDEYYIGLALTKFQGIDKFEKVLSTHPWAVEFKKYYEAFLDNENGAKKYSTEVTAKGNKLEVLEMYNSDRVPLGQLPRDSFLGSTRIKTVVWGLIFTRDGKLLIHKRKSNAKDNQGMWDKSIGGHVDIARDIDTVKAASRELLEELYKTEADQQGKDSEIFLINEEKLVFLGEWRPSHRRDNLFLDIDYNSEESYFWRLNYKFSKQVIESPRILPDKRKLPVKTFVDLYVCVVPNSFVEKVEKKQLANSDFMLLKPHQLKDLHRNKSYFNEDKNEEISVADFLPTPDLENILTSNIFEEDISSFAAYLVEKK